MVGFLFREMDCGTEDHLRGPIADQTKGPAIKVAAAA